MTDASADRFGGRLLAVRPLSVSDILDGSFRGLRAVFVPAALLVVVLIGPLTLLLNLVLSLLAPGMVGTGFGGLFEDFAQPPESPGFGVPASFFGVATIGGLVAYVITLVVSAAVVALVLQIDRGEVPEAGSAAREAARVLGTTVGASLLLLLGGMLALIVGVVVMALLVAVQPVLGVVFLFLVLFPTMVILGSALVGTVNILVPVAVIERRGVMETVRRAFWVLRRRFWRVVGVTLLIGLLVGLVGLVLQAPFLAIATFAGPVGWFVESVGEVAAQVVTIPVTVLAATLLYLDARVRFEGLDLQLRSRWYGQP